MNNFANQDQMVGIKEEKKYISNIYRKLFGIVVYKSWGEIFELELMLNNLNFSTIIELGTGFGATAVFLGAHSFSTKAKVFTFDNKEMATEQTKLLFCALDVRYSIIDIFDSESLIAYLIERPGRTLLYCDNGDKIAEMKLWG